METVTDLAGLAAALADEGIPSTQGDTEDCFMITTGIDALPSMAVSWEAGDRVVRIAILTTMRAGEVGQGATDEASRAADVLRVVVDPAGNQVLFCGRLFASADGQVDVDTFKHVTGSCLDEAGELLPLLSAGGRAPSVLAHYAD